MSKENIVKSMVLSLIIFLGCLFIISNLCYAQYNTTAYPGYLNWGYPGSYTMFGMYDSLFTTMIPLSMMNGMNSIYGIYRVDGIYSSFSSMDMSSDLFGIYSVLGGSGFMNMPGDIYSVSLGIMGGTAGKFSGLSNLDVLGGVNGTKSSLVTSGFGYLESPSLAGLGNLAGLDGLGSRAGLIRSEVTDITTYWGI